MTDQLKETRLNKGLTQVDLANRCGINRCTYNLIEKGKIKAGIKMISKLSVELDVPIAVLRKWLK